MSGTTAICQQKTGFYSISVLRPTTLSLSSSCWRSFKKKNPEKPFPRFDWFLRIGPTDPNFFLCPRMRIPVFHSFSLYESAGATFGARKAVHFTESIYYGFLTGHMLSQSDISSPPPALSFRFLIFPLVPPYSGTNF